MFITVSKAWYTRDGSQFAHGYFLLLMRPQQTLEEMLAHVPQPPVRGLVRYVRLSQFGHFMIGRITVAGNKVVLSGAYGNDGMILDVPQAVYDLGTDLPQELYDAWNSAGSEAPAMRAWGKTMMKKHDTQKERNYADLY